MKISLLTPTRGRPAAMEKLWNSALETATDPSRLEIVFYIDDDDALSLGKCSEMQAKDSRVLAVSGPRIVLSEMWNEAYKVATGEIFMHCGDDIIFRSQHWDSIVEKHISEAPGNILFVHGRDGIQDAKLGTHGFVHKNWVATIGYFVPPYFSSDYNDTWLTDVSDMIGRRMYEPAIFTEHMHWAVGKQPKDQTYSDTENRGRRDNVTALYGQLLPKRQEDAMKLWKVVEEWAAKKRSEVGRG